MAPPPKPTPACTTRPALQPESLFTLPFPAASTSHSPSLSLRPPHMPSSTPSPAPSPGLFPMGKPPFPPLLTIPLPSPSSPTPSVIKLSPRLPCSVWQEWHTVENKETDHTARRVDIRQRRGGAAPQRMGGPFGGHQGDSWGPGGEVASARRNSGEGDAGSWPSPESEPALIRALTAPASGPGAADDALLSTEVAESPQPHLESVCLNFADVEADCQDKELDRDVLEGVSIVPLPYHLEGQDQQSEQQVLYALYYSSSGQAPHFPGDEATRLLFPKWVREGLKAAAGSGVQIKQERAAKSIPSLASQKSPSPSCKTAAKNLATFSEWQNLE